MKRKIVTSLTIPLLLLSFLAIIAPSYAVPAPPADAPTLDPALIPKYVNQLIKPPVYVPTGTDATGADTYVVNMTAFTQRILAPLVDPVTGAPVLNPATGLPFPETPVWGYGGLTDLGYFRNAPGATFEARRGTAINVTYQNFITAAHLFAVDPTLHWADPNGIGMEPPTPWPAYPPGFFAAQSPVPLIPHLHGGEVHSTSDGNPEAWFTYDGTRGPAFDAAVDTVEPNEARFYYDNTQPAATLWYHDHALGITRINVMSGLAGFYLLRDGWELTSPRPLPFDAYEYPIVIQDRSFNLDGTMWFPSLGLDPSAHPYWQPEFFGDTIMVNGLLWPNLDVEQALYRFRLLDGSNARFYTLWLQVKPGPLNPLTDPDPLPFVQVGTDGGFLATSVPLTQLTLAPGERADIIVDFASLYPGDRVIVRNSAKAPFPSGETADPQTVGQILQFTVTGPLSDPTQPTTIPATLNTIPTLTPDAPSRTLTLLEKMGPLGPVEILLDGQKWAAPISETPTVGSTEDWYLVNPTADTHPIHLHLVQFQVVSRQKLNVNKYLTDWYTANNVIDPATDLPLTAPTNNVANLNRYLKGQPAPPAANELGWKDTVQANPGEITIIRVRYAPLDAPTTGAGAPTPGVNLYPFDPTTGPGYVWHCHILDHEDNEMMRPLTIQ